MPVLYVAYREVWLSPETNLWQWTSGSGYRLPVYSLVTIIIAGIGSGLAVDC